MPSRKVLLVGWDSADWKVIRPLMNAGRMPNVQRLVTNGASGQIATLHPPLSPMLWTSIATGKRPFKHGIHGFSEPAPDGSGVRPVTNLSRSAKALWNILSQNGLGSIVVGWWPSHPAEPIDGVMVSDQYHRVGAPLDEGWPMPAGSIHPPELAPVLAGLRMHPDRLTPQMVERFIPLAREIDQDKDKRLSFVLRTLAECMSIHSAAAWLLDNQPWDFFVVYYEAIDHFCHAFMRYQPPRQSWIAERDFEVYRHVVSMAYELHDEMLGTLLQKAGEDATVMLMSDHGFHPDHLRPSSIPDVPAGPAIEHRDFGVVAIAGADIRKGEPLHGASVLDVAPTILALYGLPVGEDMDGKVLAQAFVETPKVASVPSWEEIPGADGRHPPHTRVDPVAAHDALEQMIALGYIERPGANRETAIRNTIRELRFNLGQAYQDGGRHAEARAIFAELSEADPGEQRFVVALFVSCQALGLREEMRRILDEIESRNPGPDLPPVVDYLRAQVAIADRHYADALAALERVMEARPDRPDLFLQAADLYLRLGLVSEARQFCEMALAVDPDNANAHVGLARIALRQRKFGMAAQSALDALERVHHQPVAHFLLGRALVGRKEYERAAESFRAAISCNPNFPEAHLRLARVLEKHIGHAEAAREHRRLAHSMKRGTTGQTAPPAPAPAAVAVPRAAASVEMPPLSESLIVVTGLPRSGTSLVMQMLAAGGIEILSDALRPADEDNPRGYLEYEPVRNLRRHAEWLSQARGQAVKIIAPLLAALPADLPCRVILCERDLDEVLDSQERMLRRRAKPEQRRVLKDEYARMLVRTREMLAHRPRTAWLAAEYGAAISDPLLTAGRINAFLGGGLDVKKMAAEVEPALYRNQSSRAGF